MTDPVSEVMALPPLPIAAGMVKVAGSMSEVFTADQMRALQLQVKQADDRGDEAMRRAHAAEAALGELEKDAARYRWLRVRIPYRLTCPDDVGEATMPLAFDAAIDAALGAQKPEASNGR